MRAWEFPHCTSPPRRVTKEQSCSGLRRFADRTAHYLPNSDQTRSQRTTCARTPTLSAEPLQIFPTDPRIAATPSIAIWLGCLPRQRYRSIHDTAPPTFGPSGYIPSELFAHHRRPSRNFRIAGISEISSALFANTAPSTASLVMTPARRLHQLPSAPSSATPTTDPAF